MLTRRIAAYFVLPPCFSPLVLVSSPFLLLHCSRSSCFQLLSPLASFVRYVQSGIWLSVVKRLYSCLKVLNLSCIYLSPSEENSPPLSVSASALSPHYTRNLIKALFAPRVLISAARYGIAFPITIKRSSWKHGPLLYSITATTTLWNGEKRKCQTRFSFKPFKTLR